MEFHENIEEISDYLSNTMQLNTVIESSKPFMRAVFDKIRHQGKIKIIHEFNHNSKHPADHPIFVDLLKPIPKPTNEQDLYPYVRLDKYFNLQRSNNIEENDKIFEKIIEKSVQNIYQKNFIDKNTWKVSDQFKSSQNIKDTIQFFQKNYEKLKFSNKLDQNFMQDSSPALFIVNDHMIFSHDQNTMIQNFQKIIPDITSQQLISTYANQKLLNRSYSQLISENPKVNEYQIKNSRNIYKINNLDDGSIKLVANNFFDLDVKNQDDMQQYKSCGIRATVIMSPNNLPIMKYSHFIK